MRVVYNSSVISYRKSRAGAARRETVKTHVRNALAKLGGRDRV
jgi:hypothetical protein